jgi:hypothetical protein
MRWRRLCIDVDEYGEVIGGSVEYYSDRTVSADHVLVLSQSDWKGRLPGMVLYYEMTLDWPDSQLPFTFSRGTPSD